MSGNILKHSFQSKSLKAPFAFVYDFEKMIVETNKQSKPGELRKTQGRIVYYKILYSGCSIFGRYAKQKRIL